MLEISKWLLVLRPGYGQGNRRPWLLHGRGFLYGATSGPNEAIISEHEIPWLSGRLVVGFVATTAISQVVAMVALVATEPTLVATEPTLVAGLGYYL
jgi:hypothetical protein